MFLKKFFGDRAFYKKVIAISVPIMIQTGITNFVSLLDNIMVGRLGTESMSGVSIVNQFVFIFNLMIFGAISAAGIFTAQYHGLDDAEGERYTFRFKMIVNVMAAIMGVVIFALFADPLISLFLHEGSAEGDLALTLSEGKKYLRVMLFGLIPYAISQVYASTMRETEQTLLPMIASVVAVVTNFLLNLVLIFGLLGVPALGVTGAAIATVISRFAELLILVIWGHAHPKQCRYLAGAYRSLHIPHALFGRILLKGLPLMFNEVMWSISITLRNQCYSTRGLDVVAAQNINSTIVNLFNVVYMAIGSAIAILVGKHLGAGRLEEARDTGRKMITFSVICSTALAILLAATATLFPALYNTGEHVRTLATYMMLVCAATMPMCAFAHSAYFTLRSGGKVWITLLYDSVYMWAVVLPLTYILSYHTHMGIHWLFAICQSTEISKVVFGAVLIHRGSWLRQLVGANETDIQGGNV